MPGNAPPPPHAMQQMGMRPNFMGGPPQRPPGSGMMPNQNSPNQQMMGRQRPQHSGFQQGFMPPMGMNMMPNVRKIILSQICTL